MNSCEINISHPISAGKIPTFLAFKGDVLCFKTLEGRLIDAFEDEEHVYKVFEPLGTTTLGEYGTNIATKSAWWLFGCQEFGIFPILIGNCHQFFIFPYELGISNHPN